MPDQQPWPFSKPLEFLQKVKYGGAVGKKTAIAVTTLIVLAVALVALPLSLRLAGNIGALYVMIPAMLVVVAAVLWVYFDSLRSIDNSVRTYPKLALLEGTDLVAYQQLEMEMAAKNRPSIPEELPAPDPTPPTRAIEAPVEEEEG
ncbi:MAG TPA: hypothetical protein VEU62_21010 [Bryobacterales bacterium]|nr:hypothetical protein [Bryobacterales bacterium]